MIDFHSHILPGIDDGPENINESLEMAAMLAKTGFTTIYCTPHLMKGCFDADNRTVLSALINLQKMINEENIKIEILPGREYYLDEFLGHHLKHPLPLGKTKYIMVEIPNSADEEFVKKACFRIKCSGFIPMIAHPERCGHFAVYCNHQKKSKSFLGFSLKKGKTAIAKTQGSSLIDYLQEIGCGFQGNMGSFQGMYGPEVQKTAESLKGKKIFTHFGTDAHSLHSLTRLFSKSTTVNHEPLTT